MSHGSAWTPTANNAGTKPLAVLLQAARAAGWRGEPADQLAAAIEIRIVKPMSARLRAGLGDDEAEQVARVIAWERCRQLAAESPKKQDWRYLSFFVTRRSIDVLRKETRRRQRHPLVGDTYDGVVPGDTRPVATSSHHGGLGSDPMAEHEGLGPTLETFVAMLESAGCSSARRWVTATLDSDRPSFKAIVDRAVAEGASPPQARALAKLLRGKGAGALSVVGRLATGESAQSLLTESAVRSRIALLTRPERSTR